MRRSPTFAARISLALLLASAAPGLATAQGQSPSASRVVGAPGGDAEERRQRRGQRLLIDSGSRIGIRADPSSLLQIRGPSGDPNRCSLPYSGLRWLHRVPSRRYTRPARDKVPRSARAASPRVAVQ